MLNAHREPRWAGSPFKLGNGAFALAQRLHLSDPL